MEEGVLRSASFLNNCAYFVVAVHAFAIFWLKLRNVLD